MLFFSHFAAMATGHGASPTTSNDHQGVSAFERVEWLALVPSCNANLLLDLLHDSHLCGNMQRTARGQKGNSG